ncbi:MAG TPA: hypothetical protein VMR41_02085 [Patescibacteria group bacterium]|nr:hypothetical protein [Patescibacteria group bacterium]
MKKFITIFSLFLIVFFVPIAALADDTPTPSPTTDPNSQTSSIGDCSDNHISVADCPGFLQGKVDQLHGQETTLTQTIAVMTNQINLTQARIEATQEQLTELEANIQTATTKITTLNASLETITQVLLKRIVATYETNNLEQTQAVLASTNLNDLVERSSYLKIVQAHDKKLIYDTQQAQTDYANQKGIFEAQKLKAEQLKQSLQTYSDQLAQQQQQKQALLTQTQGDESTYESLLSEAKAQLAGFSNFVNSQGGATILSGQTVCDGWGCYYNQRDSQWGNVALNNTEYSIASDGCLLTSMAMVYTHYGHRSVTPLTINSNPSNFAAYEPAYLLKTIVADGATSNRISSEIDSVLSGGDPVIVGISYDGGPYPDHFVVLISGSNGSYTMNDPFVANGHEIAFTDHYSVGSIREIDRVSM